MLGLTWCNGSVQPQCKELEERCNTQSESYETKKKEVIGMLMCVFLSPHTLILPLHMPALLNKKAGLEDTLTRQQRQLESIHLPQVRVLYMCALSEDWL